ncbi:hypothetical protein X907_1709 [Glycocaulis alkaliphilus]|uniref:Uncharacterized protein n=1 Tax=Glycocaulis alkaliphilus TaxID=1434191 RepID=A0A3T0EAD5_9PROT|nr:hypothetical protein X907_1709 [Glycocaulis alkaliphilus]
MPEDRALRQVAGIAFLGHAGRTGLLRMALTFRRDRPPPPVAVRKIFVTACG